MATSFVQVTYYLVDMAWLGRLGTGAVAAAGTVGTYLWLINSLMLIPRIGVSIRGSQAYGAGDYEGTKRAFRNGLQMAFALALVLTILCLAFSHQLIGLYNFTEDVAGLGVDYLTVLALGNVYF